ncbi:uncharacterized protein B0I36DRAFT_364299 [Microdochium trichocladiopsis]|uniref:C2 domain-containing protein n=1 Tax=Microdochium trichocladiopsis TaxID=1682393 RepID=A0A9P8Y5N3_9PEZI|nr:uncharacterized protein B0I36DRAFT_364299 [Microdochium trichocladiopsis]KAH7029824.1 hypothetical protein B0I36DRAFT_364299 [Microdochium trichocladiopsis]
MAAIIDRLSSEGPGESAGFLNDIVAQLWPNIDAAGSKMIKDIVDPMFKTMLPGPLATLHFTHVELGDVPFKFSDVRVTKTPLDGIKLDLQVNWAGKCDIELDADMFPKVGVKSVELHGRLSVLLCPLTNVIPLIGAAQVAFVNPPELKLDFTGAANIADFSVLDNAVRKVILSVINGMFTLPNRFLVKMDSNADYFKTYHYPLGVVRVTVDKAWGFAEEAQSKAKKLLSKLTRASPDCYATVQVGAEEEWRTTTKNNTTTPAWGETHDFVVSDFDQLIVANVHDHDVGSDDHVGLATVSVKDILLAGGKKELAMVYPGGEETGGRIALSAEFFEFAPEDSSFSASSHKGDDKLCGVLSVLVAGALGIKGPREELKPSIVVTWGDKHRFQTAVKADAPGTDINNPSFDQQFRIPLTSDLVGSSAAPLRIACLNGEQEVGSVEIPFADVLKAPEQVLQDQFDLGNGTKVRACFTLRGVKAAKLSDTALPTREK